MHERRKLEGFIFGQEFLGEGDKIFSIFTKEAGKIEVLGKGIRKINSKLAPQMEIFSLVEIEFVEGKMHKKLVGARKIERFKNIKKDFKKIIVSYQIGELMNRLLKPEEKDARIWQLVKKVFFTLNEISFKKVILAYLYFFWNLISFLGYAPTVSFCTICKKKPLFSFYFDPQIGGLACQKCAKKAKIKNKVKKETLTLLKVILFQNLSFLKKIKIPPKILKETLVLGKEYLNYYQTKNENP